MFRFAVNTKSEGSHIIHSLRPLHFIPGSRGEVMYDLLFKKLSRSPENRTFSPLSMASCKKKKLGLLLFFTVTGVF